MILARFDLFGQHKPMMGHKITKSKNKDLFAIQSRNTSGKTSIVTKTIDEISELKSD